MGAASVKQEPVVGLVSGRNGVSLTKLTVGGYDGAAVLMIGWSGFSVKSASIVASLSDHFLSKADSSFVKDDNLDGLDFFCSF